MTGFTSGPIILGQEPSWAATPSAPSETLTPGEDTAALRDLLLQRSYVEGGPTGFMHYQPLAPGEVRGTQPQMMPAPTISAEEANRKYGITGHLAFKSSVPEEVAAARQRDTLRELKRQQIAARAPGGFTDTVQRFGFGVLGGFMDPLDIAANFVPVVGEARYARWLGRAGSSLERGAIRFGVGAAQGVAGQIPLEVLRAAEASQNNRDWSATDALLNLAYGGLMGGGIHATLGGVFGRLEPQAREAAFRGAIARVVDGEPVNVQPVVAAAAVRDPTLALAEGPGRPTWEQGFPAVATTTSLKALEDHPLYPQAKAGNIDAARELVDAKLTPEAIARAREIAGDTQPIVVPVRAPVLGNQIPAALADRIAKEVGGTAEPGIHMRQPVNHTGASFYDRTVTPPEFRGEVIPGKVYLVVDDVVTYGSTVANLIAHIQRGGGRVAGVISMATGRRGATLAPKPEILARLRKRHGALEADWKHLTGSGFEGLTFQEALHLAQTKTTRELRDQLRLAAGRRAAALRGQPGMPSSAALAADSGGANITSAGVAPPFTQLEPSQRSTQPEPSADLTSRTTAPSTVQGGTMTPVGDVPLGSIDETSNRKVIQGSNDLKVLHEAATRILPAVDVQLRAIAAKIPGAEYYGARVKDWAGLELKAKGRPPATISDVIGGRFTVDGPEALDRLVQQIGGLGRVLESEDFIATGKFGYRGVHLQIELPNRMSIEIQVQPREIRAVQDAAHAIRDSVKRMPDGPMNAEQMAHYEATMAKAQTLFDQAWEPVAEKWASKTLEAPAGINRRGIRMDKAILPDGAEIPVQYAVVEAADLQTSHLDDFRENPNYPQALQPRDRTRSQSAIQVNSIAQNLNPKLLDNIPMATDGAPIIGSDGTVESGNGRVMGIRRAYQEDLPSAKAYRDYLAGQGYPIDGMKAPVLVRIREQPMTMGERADFARRGNQRTTLEMSDAEQAKADGRALPDSVLSLYRGGDIGLAANREFVVAFARGVVGDQEMGSFVTDQGGLSAKGRRRIEAAMLARAYDDQGLLSALLDDPENDIKAIGKALTEAAPTWAMMRGEARDGSINPQVDITKDLLDAVNLVRRARQTGTKVKDLLAQQDAFSGFMSQEAEAILRVLYRNDDLTKPRAGDKVVEWLNAYVAQARESKAGPGLFGAADVVGPADIFRTLAKRNEAPGQADIFARPAGGAPSDGGGVPQAGDLGQGPGVGEPGGQAPGLRPPVSGIEYPPHLEGETDKAWFKRVRDKIPENTGPLPDRPELYFDLALPHEMIPVDRLKASKAGEEYLKGERNAAKLFRAAIDGVVGKRGPLDVVDNGDGTFTVKDGNATLAAARKAGWAELPVSPVKRIPADPIESAIKAVLPAKDAADVLAMPKPESIRPEQTAPELTDPTVAQRALDSPPAPAPEPMPQTEGPTAALPDAQVQELEGLLATADSDIAQAEAAGWVQASDPEMQALESADRAMEQTSLLEAAYKQAAACLSGKGA